MRTDTLFQRGTSWREALSMFFTGGKKDAYETRQH